MGRSLVHEEGMALILQWIGSMEYPELMKEHEEREATQNQRLTRLRTEK